MRNASFFEGHSPSLKAEFCVERNCMHLAMQYDLFQPLRSSEIQQRRYDHPADTTAAVSSSYRHATESTGGF